MRTPILALVLFGLMAGAAHAQTQSLTLPGAATSAGTGQMGLTVATATSLTIPAGTKAAQITVEGESVRCRDDGVAPTASTGVLYPVATVLVEWMPALAGLQCIQTTATATLDVAYYR